MKLPFKTRQTIYLSEFPLCYPAVKSRGISKTNGKWDMIVCLSNTDNEGHLLPASLAQPALTRVNRQIRAETLSLYYESNELFLLRLESDVEEGWWSSREMHHRRRHLQLLRGLSALAAAGRLALVQHLVILCSPQGVRYHVTKQRPRVRPMMGNDSDGDGKGAEWKDENNYELGVVMPDLHWIWEAQTVGWYEDRDLMRWTEIGFATHEVDWNLHHFTGDLLAHPERYGGASREDAKMMSKMATGRIAEVLAIIVGDGGKKGENFVFV